MKMDCLQSHIQVFVNMNGSILIGRFTFWLSVFDLFCKVRIQFV